MSINAEPILCDLKGPREIEKHVLDFMKNRSPFFPLVLKDINKTTKSWKGEKPSYSSKIKQSKRQVYLFLILLRGSKKAINKWNWLERGTPKHTISARRAPMLVFQTGYVAGSAPYKQGSQRLISRNASRSGGYARRPSVEHPGIKARGWRKIMADKHRKKFAASLVVAITYGIRRSGHAKKRR